MIESFRHNSRRRRIRAALAMGVAVVVGALVVRLPFPRVISGVALAIAEPFAQSIRMVGKWGLRLNEVRHSTQRLAQENLQLRDENVTLKLLLIDARRQKKEYEALVAFVPMVRADTIVAGVLVRPPASLYDTLILDRGLDAGVVKGDAVLAVGGVAIGSIEDVFSHSARAVLFSSPGNVHAVVVTGRGISGEARGRGAGNFEMRLPRDIPIAEGDVVSLPGLGGMPLGVVGSIVSAETDPFALVLFRSPLSLATLSYVLIDRSRRL